MSEQDDGMKQKLKMEWEMSNFHDRFYLSFGWKGKPCQYDIMRLLISFFFCFIGNDRHRLVTLSAMWTRNWSRSHDTGRSHLFNESKCAAWPRFTTLLLQFTYSIQRNCILLGQVLLLIILPDTTLRHFGIVMCLRMYSDSHIFVFCAQLGQTMSTSNEINWFYTLHVTLIRNQRVPELKCFSLSTDTGSTQLLKWADPYKSNWWFRLA